MKYAVIYNSVSLYKFKPIFHLSLWLVCGWHEEIYWNVLSLYWRSQFVSSMP